MIIESLHIDKFAGLSDFSISLGPGLNIIEGKNESGKSTVASFIKFLFYGLSGQKTNGEELSERERHMPFNSSYAGGSAVLISGGKRYILERRLSVSSSGIRESVRDEVMLIDEQTGEKIAVGKDAGQVLFGVSAKVFADTAYFRQLADSAPNKAELTEAIGNILFSGEEGTDVKKAMKRLDDLRTSLRHKKGVGGELAELETEMEELRERLQRAEGSNRAIISLEGEIGERTAKKETLDARLEKAKKRMEAGEIYRKLALREEIKKHEKAAEDAVYALKEIAPDGKLPTAENISLARITAAELPVLQSRAADASAELARIKDELASLPEYSEIENTIDIYGGADALRASVGSMLSSFKKKLTVGAVLTVLGAVCAAAAMVLELSITPVLLCGGAVLGAVGIALMLLSASPRKRARALMELFGRGCSYEGFCDGVERYKRDHSRFCDLTDKRTEAEQALNNANIALADGNKKAEVLINDLGCTAEGELAAALTKAAKNAEEKREKTLELKSAYTAAKAHADAARRDAGEESEGKLKARLEELGVADADAVDIKACEREVEFYRTQSEMQEKEIYNRKISLAEHKAKAEDPCEIAGRLNEAQKTYAAKTRQYNACVKAIEALGTAGQNLRGGVAPYLSEGACRRLSAVTGGKYSGIRVDGELSAVCISPDGIRSLEYFSAGTRDLAYISLRLALIDLLYKREKPPVVFDESFAHQDKNRTALALKLLSSEGERGIQSLLFTCRNFEAQSAEYGSFEHIIL